jgi:hypothetical protein
MTSDRHDSSWVLDIRVLPHLGSGHEGCGVSTALRGDAGDREPDANGFISLATGGCLSVQILQRPCLGCSGGLQSKVELPNFAAGPGNWK